MVTGGVSNDAVDFNIAVIRFNSDGTLDNTLMWMEWLLQIWEVFMILKFISHSR
ncbi:MAG: hypothetical protein IPO85_14065 [Saprospiraceae bacterium]|uniref:Uncharacterized protein n=1 Tax=Candidatus Defluviibacterium haderslevense TaxID=2981993 RepID=A0A9D7SA63_9BACT|nr:hypothetical protein [Candidatus Defluviibacterium haderslevense]